MLGDPVRAVRIEAARALAGPAEAGLAPEERTRFDRALAEYVAVQTYNADRPDGHGRLAEIYAARGNAEGAIAEYRKAIELDPTYVQAYANLADLYRARGVDSEAEAVLRVGHREGARCGGAPSCAGPRASAAEAHRRGAEANWPTASRLDPDNARYAYVYAVALNDAGQPQARRCKVLGNRAARNPYDRDVLAALAHFRARAGDARSWRRSTSSSCASSTRRIPNTRNWQADRGPSAAPVTRARRRRRQIVWLMWYSPSSTRFSCC